MSRFEIEVDRLGASGECPFRAHFGFVAALLVAETPRSSGAPGWIRTSDTFFRRVARIGCGRQATVTTARIRVSRGRSQR